MGFFFVKGEGFMHSRIEKIRMDMQEPRLEEDLERYRWAVFFIKDVPAEVIVRDKATVKERVAAYQKIYRMVSDLESMAFYDGHYLAFGFAAGSCRHTFCGQQQTCQAMTGAVFLCFPDHPWKLAAATFTGWSPRPDGTSTPLAAVPSRRIFRRGRWPGSSSCRKGNGRGL
jgi:hypothetical protein